MHNHEGEHQTAETTSLRTTYRMAEHNRYAAHKHNSKDLEYDLTPKKRTSLKQTNDQLDVQVYVQIRVTGHSVQTRASHHSQSRSKHSSPQPIKNRQS